MAEPKDTAPETEAVPTEETETQVDVEYNDNLGDDTPDEEFDFAAQLAERKILNPEWYEDEEGEEAEGEPAPVATDTAGEEPEDSVAAAEEQEADESEPETPEPFSRARRVLERKEKQLRDERTELAKERAELDQLRAEVGAGDVNKRKAILDPQEHLRGLGLGDQQLMQLAQDIHLDQLSRSGATLTPEQEVLRQARRAQREAEAAKLDAEATPAVPEQTPAQRQQLADYQEQLFSFEVPEKYEAIQTSLADPTKRSYFKPAMWETAVTLSNEFASMGVNRAPTPDEVADRLNAVLIQSGVKPAVPAPQDEGADQPTTDEQLKGQPRRRARKSIRQSKPGKPRAASPPKDPDKMTDEEYNDYCRKKAAAKLDAVYAALK